jgi:hypothetical protein
MTRRPPSILEACADRHLLGVSLYPAQAEFLSIIESGTYTDLVAAWGRRSGKSLVAATWSAYDAVFRDLSAYLRWRERRSVVIVAASREQAGVTLGYVRELLENSPTLATAIVGQTDESVTVRQPMTGAHVTIRTAPCSARSIRGAAASTIVLDECGHWLTDSEGPAVASRVYRSLRPSTVQFREHGRALLISSPWGQQGLFFERYSQAVSGEHPEMHASRLATWEVNPSLSRDVLEPERHRDPLGFESEFAAEFAAGGDALFDAGQLDARIRGRRELAPGDVAGAWIGLDAAFTRDSFAAVVVDRDQGDPSRLRLVAVREWRPSPGRPVDFEHVIGEIALLGRRYGLGRAYTDQHAGQPIVQALRKAGLAASVVTLTAQSKPAGWLVLRQRITDGTLELYRHDALLSQLRQVTVFYGSGGRQDVRQPRTSAGHGDLASALMLAVSQARGASTAPVVYSAADVRIESVEAERGWTRRVVAAGGTLPEQANTLFSSKDAPRALPVAATGELGGVVHRQRGMSWSEHLGD